MTGYIKKIPIAVAIIFFAVGAFSATFNGAGILTAVGRGAVAGFIASLFGILLAYILFDDPISEPEVPEEFEPMMEKYKRKNK